MMRKINNKKKPTVSIILPIYKKAFFINEAIKSVQAQTVEDWELIIIADPPASKMAEKIIEKYCQEDLRINYFKNKTRVGFSKSLNQGLKIAKGKYIARIDDDDIWHNKNKLKKQTEFLEKQSDYILVGSGAIAVDGNGKELYRFLEPEKDEEIRNYILYRNPFLHSSVVFQTNVARKMGYYNEKWAGAVDYDFWLLLGKVGKFYNFPEYLIKFRIPPLYRNVKGVRRQRIKRTIEKIGIIKNYQKDYPHFYQAICRDYLKLIYLLSIARFPGIDNWFYKRRQVRGWRI